MGVMLSEANIEHDKWLDDRAPASVIADYQMQWLLEQSRVDGRPSKFGSNPFELSQKCCNISNVSCCIRDNLTEVQPGLDLSLKPAGR